MPKNDALKNAPIADENPVDASPETPADATPPEVRDLSEREPRSYAERMERELRVPRGGEGAVVITALLDLHRTVGAGSSGPTIRGRKGEQSNRYLEAARLVGDQLVNDLLGPSEGATR